MTDVDRMSAKFANMNADKAPPPARGAIVNGGGGSLWGDGGSGSSAVAGSSLKPHAQVKLLSPTEKCKVCNEAAAKHVHYGAMTCFSCRAFFRRSIQNKTAASYACRRNRSCEINIKTRKNCQYCRYQRCIAVGMKPTWVLSEEERQRRFRKHREKQAAAAGGEGGGRARSSDSMQDEDYLFGSYTAAGSGLLHDRQDEEEEEDEEGGGGGGGGDEDDQEEEEEQESKAGLQRIAAAAAAAAAAASVASSAGLYSSLGGGSSSSSQEAGKLLGRPQIQLSHVRSSQSGAQTVRVDRHQQSPETFLSTELIKHEPRCSPVSPPVYEMTQIPGMKQEPQTQILRTVSSALQQTYSPVAYTHQNGFISQKVYLATLPSSQGASVIVQPHQQQQLQQQHHASRYLNSGLSSQRVAGTVVQAGAECGGLVLPDRQDLASAMDTDITDIRQLVELIHPDSLQHHTHPHPHLHHPNGSSSNTFEMTVDGRGAGGGGSASSPRSSSILFPNVAPPGLPARPPPPPPSHQQHHHHRANNLVGPLGGVLTGPVSVTTRTSPVVMGVNNGSGLLSATSSPEIYGGGDDGASLYSGGRSGGGGSDGGGETGFSVNDFVETFMEGQEEEEEEAGSSGTEYPDDVYSDSDEEECDSRRKPVLKLTEEEDQHLNILVENFNERYRSVNFGEELIKEMIMCSMFGIPVSTSAAISGYRLSVERMTRVANSMPSFQTLTKADQTALLKENADLLVSMRGAIFFDTKKKGVDQILLSMGNEDMQTIRTTFAQLLNQDSMKHIDYKTFNSIQAVGQSNTEDRYNYIQEKVGKMLFDDTINILLTFVILFSADFCMLQEYARIVQIQDDFTRLLQRYIYSSYPRAHAVQYFANSLQVITWIREMADIKKQRAINSSVRLP